MESTYFQFTRQTGEFLSVPAQILRNARFMSGPNDSTFIYYENGGYDHVREKIQNLEMAKTYSQQGEPRRPTKPIGENLDFIRAVYLTRESPGLRCLVSHAWPVIDDELLRYMSINHEHPDPIQVGNFQIDTKNGHWMGGPDAEEIIGLWDVYYLPKGHVMISRGVSP